MRLNPKKTTTATTGAPPPQGEAEDHHPVTPDDNGPSSQPLVLHRQQALSQHSAAGDVIDLTKRLHKQKGKKEDEVSRRDDLSPEARTVLRGLARTFVESCFNRAYPFISFLPPCPYSIFPRILFAVTVDNWGQMSKQNVITACLFLASSHTTAFLASLLKDIKSERPKITEKDHLRLLFVTKWFLEYFLAVRTQEKEVGAPPASGPWAFGLVGEVIERGWIVWVLKRMNGAVEEKVGMCHLRHIFD